MCILQLLSSHLRVLHGSRLPGRVAALGHTARNGLILHALGGASVRL
jgi:hypothetical protein